MTDPSPDYGLAVHGLWEEIARLREFGEHYSGAAQDAWDRIAVLEKALTAHKKVTAAARRVERKGPNWTYSDMKRLGFVSALAALDRFQAEQRKSRRAGSASPGGAET